MTTPTQRLLAIARETGYAGIEARAERLLGDGAEVRATAAMARVTAPGGVTRDDLRQGHIGGLEDHHEHRQRQAVEPGDERLPEGVARGDHGQSAEAHERKRDDLKRNHLRLRAARAVACAATGPRRKSKAASRSALSPGWVHPRPTSTAAATKNGGTDEAAIA